MKVITEKVLRKILKRHFGDDVMNQSLASHLINECQELDTLTVTKLRPMCEAPIRGDILVKMKQGSRLREGFCDDGLFYVPGNHFKLDDCDGFIPMPTYNPEEK